MARFSIILCEKREKEFIVDASDKLSAVMLAKQQATFEGWDPDLIEMKNLTSGI